MSRTSAWCLSESSCTAASRSASPLSESPAARRLTARPGARARALGIDLRRLVEIFARLGEIVVLHGQLSGHAQQHRVIGRLRESRREHLERALRLPGFRERGDEQPPRVQIARRALDARA